jgi:hypothetical protein
MQERVQAGVPFPATINVFDKYQNKITELSPDFPGVRLKAGGFEPISPGRISGQLFEDGIASVYLIYPRSGELMVEAEVLTDPDDRIRVERLFIERGVEEARIHIVSSAKPQAKINSNVPGNQIKVEFQPAYLSGDENHYSFSNWFLNRIIQRQRSYQPLPKVELLIYPRDEVRHSKSLQNNLFTLKLERFETEIPTLQEIQSLILQENYSEAAEKLEIYLDENPDDPYATRLRYRLERIQEVTSP